MKKKRRMQRALAVALTACMAAACFAPSAMADDTGGTGSDSSGYTVQLVPLDSDGNEITGETTASYTIGEKFGVALKISGADYAAFQLDLKYDSTQLKYVDAKEATASSESSGDSNFKAQDSASPGTITASIFGDSRTAGSTAAVFYFTGLVAGSTPALTLENVLVGAQGADLDTSGSLAAESLSGCKVKIHGEGVTVSGSVVSYNPQNAVTVTLYKSDDTEHATAIYTGTIAAAESGSGQTTQSFSVEGVEAGTYDIVVTKAAHLTYTIKSVTVGSEALDLTTSTNDAVKTITLLAGDINGDAKINTEDLNGVWNDANYNKSAESAGNKLTDINGDGKVNTEDLNIIWNDSNYNKSAADNCTVNY